MARRKWTSPAAQEILKPIRLFFIPRSAVREKDVVKPQRGFFGPWDFLSFNKLIPVIMALGGSVDQTEIEGRYLVLPQQGQSGLEGASSGSGEVFGAENRTPEGLEHLQEILVILRGVIAVVTDDVTVLAGESDDGESLEILYLSGERIGNDGGGDRL